MLINLLSILFRNGEGSGKVIGNASPGPDHHQSLISEGNQPISLKSVLWFGLPIWRTDGH